MTRGIIQTVSSEKLAYNISEKSGIPLLKVLYDRFPDNDYFAKLESEMPEEVYIIQRTFPDQDKSYMELFFLADAAKKNGAKKVTAVIPYFAYARQDKPEPGEIHSLETIFKLLGASGVDKVLTVDSHFFRKEGVCEKYAVPCKNITASKLLFEEATRRYGLDNPMAVSPDKGGELIAVNLGGESFSKKRIDSRNVEIEGSDLVYNWHVIILDDMITTGGTTETAIKEAKKQGATAIAVASTHGLFLKNAYGKISSLTNYILTTDTVMSNIVAMDFIKPISVADLIAENL